jgi:hypothetical protein
MHNFFVKIYLSDKNCEILILIKTCFQKFSKWLLKYHKESLTIALLPTTKEIVVKL